ncbi:hypothetical protein H4R18_000473 [Coemansia javaensis]|uniref:Peptidase S1 domain-containing protein n=1 Tax=Coemansia javaensis TaxID=2761396 RepID=A0A9W8HI43_9FUNG|nr:hypothetical protein H4R18_000473 [Coemansia javaensis]
MLATYAAGQHEPFAKRLAISRVNDMNGGILIKNGVPTTCELALNSDRIAFVAASCLDFQPNSNILDPSTRYQVAISSGTSTSISTLGVGSVFSHPKYNPRTFANNVAVVKLNPGSTGAWRNYIAANPADWQSVFYVDRGLTGPNTWAATQVAPSSVAPPPQCATASALYAANTRDFLCTDRTTTGQGNCAAPYGSVYGVHDPDLAVGALYSHSVVLGNDLCSGSQVYSYYTILSNFLEWGGAVTGETVYLYTADRSYVNNKDPNYRMIEPSGAVSVTGLLLSGDLNTNKGVPVSPAPSAVQTSGPAPTLFEIGSPTSMQSVSSDASDEHKKKVSVSTILLIVGALLALLGALAWFLFKRCKRRPAPQHEMTQYNNNEYALGSQNYQPEYLDEYQDRNRMHLNNEIVTRDDYHDHNPNGNDNGKGYMD